MHGIKAPSSRAVIIEQLRVRGGTVRCQNILFTSVVAMHVTSFASFFVFTLLWPPGTKILYTTAGCMQKERVAIARLQKDRCSEEGKGANFQRRRARKHYDPFPFTGVSGIITPPRPPAPTLIGSDENEYARGRTGVSCTRTLAREWERSDSGSSNNISSSPSPSHDSSLRGGGWEEDRSWIVFALPNVRPGPRPFPIGVSGTKI